MFVGTNEWLLFNIGFLPKGDERCPATRISCWSGLWVGIRFAERGGSESDSAVLRAVNDGFVYTINKYRDQWREQNRKKIFKKLA